VRGAVLNFEGRKPLACKGFYGRMNQPRTATLIVAVACAAGTLAAQQPEEASSLAQCAAIESAVARLDCFDALARRARASEAAPAPQGESAARRASESVVSEPERAVPNDSEVSRREERAADRGQRELTSQVAALREIQPGRLEVTLANGQVWRQTSSDRYHLLVGHEVRVYPSGFGQYFRLTSKESRGFIQVERVR
jgi:hypothetical protein